MSLRLLPIFALVIAGVALLLSHRSSSAMPSLNVARTSNNAWKPKARPVGIFFGGTSGIGQAMAERLANQTEGNAHIVLLGRNKEAAEKIIAGFPKHADSKYEFERVDATSMKDVRRVTTSLSSRLDKVNFIVATTGYLTLKGRDENEEGIDKKLAVNVYARYRFIQDLLPKIEKAVEQGEDGKVMSVLAAGRGSGYINLQDLGLKKEFSMRNAESAAIIYNDAMMSAWAAKHAKIPFVHIFPGIVNTPIINNFHWSLKLLSPALKFFTITPAECAEYMWSPLWSTSADLQSGAHQLDNHGEACSPNKALTPEVVKAVSEHLESSTA